jgi:hypothetical protein
MHSRRDVSCTGFTSKRKLERHEKAMSNIFADTLVSFLSSMSLVRQSSAINPQYAILHSHRTVHIQTYNRTFFVLISEFENRKTRLFMREKLPAKCLAPLRNLVHKYEHIPYIAFCS